MRFQQLFCGLAVINGVLACAFSTKLVLADENRPGSESEFLDTVVVTASRGSSSLSASELPASTTVLKREQILASPGRTLDELLREVAGVQLPPLNSLSSFPVNPSVALRGVGLGDNGTRTLVLLNGIPVNGAFFGNIFWNRIPKNDIERIEIVRGSSSSVFGSLAIGGVISIFTRTPGSETRATVDLRGGSDSTYAGDFSLGGALNDNFSMSIAGNYFETGGYFLTRPEDRSPIDAPTDNELFNISVATAYQVDEKLSAELRLDYYEQDQRTSTRLSTSETEVLSLTGGIEAQLDPVSRLRGTLFYSDEDFQNDGTSTVVRGVRDAEFVSNTHLTPAESLGGSLVYSREISELLRVVSLGIDWRRLEGKDDQDIFTSDGQLFLNQIAGGKQRFVGLFTEVSAQPHSRLTLLASVRYDDVSTSDATRVLDGVVEELPEIDFDRLNTRIGLNFKASSQITLYGAFARGFRAPTLAELYRRFGTSSFVGLPNPELEQETSSSGEAGLRFEYQRVHSEINLFRINLDNQIGSVVAGFGPFTLRNENVGEARSQGLEWITKARLTPNLALDVSYTYTDTEILENLDDPEILGNRLEGAPEHTALFGLLWSPQQWKVNLRARFVDKQFQDLSNETRLPSHWVIDAGARYRFTPAFEAFVNIENLLDNTYTASAFGGLDRRGAPLQVLAGFSWRMQ